MKKTKTQPKHKTATALSARHLRFIDEYMIDLNATAAYLRAGYKATGNAASVNAAQLLRKPHVAAEVKRRQAERSEATNATSDEVLRQAWMIVRADPRELVTHRRFCCRYCWGKGHRYQRTDAELAKEREEFERRVRQRGARTAGAVFDEKGGSGFNGNGVPNPECPECFGDGIGRVIIGDLDNLSPEGAALFAGIKKTKDGIEVKMHDKLEALEKVARHIGFYAKDSLTLNVNPLAELLAQISGEGSRLPTK